MNAPAEPSAVAGALADPVRRKLLETVTRSEAPVSRDQAAAAVGIPRTTAAFHLDRLVAAGLLLTEFKRVSGRTGPGAGRPAKLYRAAASEVSLTVPARDYELAARLMLGAIDRAEADGRSARAALDEVSSEVGTSLGREAATLHELLESAGYEPASDGAGGLVLANCPFRSLTRDHRETVCGANLALLSSAVEATDAQGLTARFEPSDECCCVHLVPADAN